MQSFLFLCRRRGFRERNLRQRPLPEISLSVSPRIIATESPPLRNRPNKPNTTRHISDNSSIPKDTRSYLSVTRTLENERRVPNFNFGEGVAEEPSPTDGDSGLRGVADAYSRPGFSPEGPLVASSSSHFHTLKDLPRSTGRSCRLLSKHSPKQVSVSQFHVTNSWRAQMYVTDIFAELKRVFKNWMKHSCRLGGRAEVPTVYSTVSYIQYVFVGVSNPLTKRD